MLEQNDDHLKNEQELDNNGAGENSSNFDEGTKDALKDIDNAIIDNSESDAETLEETTVKNYDDLSLELLVKELELLINTKPVQTIKDTVEQIKSAFNFKFSKLLAAKKKAFLDDGGDSIDFKFNSPVKTAYNTILATYKKQRDTYYKVLERQMSENLEKRLQVIEDLKTLIKDANTNTMYKEFRVLQDRWRAVGPVAKSYYADTWKTYHHHVERFYDLLHLRNEYRDLDFKNNLEEKLKIIARAEALAESDDDINTVFKELQGLHKRWKEDVGPVPKEVREDIWKKFSAATKKIHDKRHENFKQLKLQHAEIESKKLVIIEQLRNYYTSKNRNHKDWQNSIKEVDKIRNQYFNAGKLPHKKSEELWQQFKTATKQFNVAKNKFYKQEKAIQQDNLNKKLALIEIAETLKDSTDWDTATQTFKRIQNDWKKIGHVPRKFSDTIWKNFKSACNAYFDRLHKQRHALTEAQEAVIESKKAFTETLKSTKTFTKEDVLKAITSYRALGTLPSKAKYLDTKFNKQIDSMLDALSLDPKDVALLKFTTVVDSLFANKDVKKLDAEQVFVRKKIDEVSREIQQLENNLGFFSNVKEDSPVVLNVKQNVAKFNNELDIWKTKLKYLKQLKY